MPELPNHTHNTESEQDVWLQSLANLGKRLIAPPSKVDEKAPAGDER